MARPLFHDERPRLRLTADEFNALRVGKPVALSDELIGYRWCDDAWGGVRVYEFRGIGPDGWLIDVYKPVIRVPAISRMVPRPQAAS